MIIGISGRMGSGKNTVGDIIEKICLTNEGPVFEQKSFAGKLKQIASLLTGIPVEKFEDQEFKKTLLSPEWGTIHTNPLNSIPVFEDVRFLHMMSVRELLQKLGTEAMRDGLHENVWVNALFADYKSKRELLQADGTWIESDTGEVDFAVSIKYPKWIITDMRFPNEMDAIKEKGGITIRVVRNNNTKYSDKKVKSILKDMGYVDLSDGVWEELAINEGFTWFETFKLWTWDEDDNNNEALHPSETALDDAKFDYEIINDGEIVDLIEKVKTILIKEKII
jgi:hypothetical protein